VGQVNILIVEDESIVQLDLQSRLRRLGHTVVAVASCGEEAVRKAAQYLPDLVLMDVRLQGEMDGAEAARQIRAARNVPVIYLTAYVDATQPATSSLLQPYVAKPFRTDELHTAIQNATSRNSES
jgi:two-component system, cell cycle sensor histidine kinase and response regulator CckA